MEQEVLHLADRQMQLVISNALNCLVRISPVRSHVFLRCRSSSRNRSSRKAPFHSTIPRYSMPQTKNDRIHYQSRSLSCQTRFPISANSNCHGTNRTFDIQYSFSLYQSWLTKINQQQSNLNSIQNFADELVEHTIETVLFQLESDNLINDHDLSDEDETSLPLSNSCLSLLPADINSYVDQFIHTTINQALANMPSSAIKIFSSRLTEDIIADVLFTIGDDEIYLQKLQYKSQQFEDMEQQQQANLFNQFLFLSSTVARASSDNSSTDKESIDSLVNNIAQEIYENSFDELRYIFTVDSSVQ